MTLKRALIVDDSKSARFALKRMLKELKLEVDTVESAADAMLYLEDHLPDVIFMDHMMPGMDGFEAVKRIKKNPQTAVIPIMMYTSKAGDVYLSQARALGAVGIIRKTIAPVELKESLLELGIIDNVPHESTLKVDQPVENKPHDNNVNNVNNETKEAPVNKENVLETYVKDLRKLMDDQTIELHRSMWLGIESVSNEIYNRLNSDFEEKIEKIQSTPKVEDIERSSKHRNKMVWLAYVASFLLIMSVVFNVSLLSKFEMLEHKLEEVTLEEEILAEEKIASDENESLLEDTQAREGFIDWAQAQSIIYPYDEVALNDSRLSKIEEVIERALEANYKGRIVLQTHAGSFCFSVDQAGDYKLAADDTSIANCEFMGNYIQPDDESTSHQSLGFVNYLSDTELLEEQGIIIEVMSIDRKQELSEYPKRTPLTTAEEWNQAAKLNNCVTITLEPTI
ncbi:hypothetical protein MNBD_GAMMA08-135 [hydrothermal vent metagenome]|uniref:Response regulatory domain-containing protein n=1 Tax=hydrothermal vent metagenome TaxID=652676 RepID=A0A3B0XD04_9ZZZZ